MFLARTTNDIAEMVRARRLELGWSQTALAQAAGVGRTFVALLEGGKPTSELRKTLDVVAALGIVVVGFPVDQDPIDTAALIATIEQLRTSQAGEDTE